MYFISLVFRRDVLYRPVIGRRTAVNEKKIKINKQQKKKRVGYTKNRNTTRRIVFRRVVLDERRMNWNQKQ